MNHSDISHDCDKVVYLCITPGAKLFELGKLFLGMMTVTKTGITPAD